MVVWGESKNYSVERFVIGEDFTCHFIFTCSSEQGVLTGLMLAETV